MTRLAENPPLKGIILIVVAIGMFSVMDTTAKYLAQFYPVPGIVWARYAINFAIISAYLAYKGRFGAWRSKRPVLQVVRGFLLVSATLFYFTSLSVLPIAEAAGIGFVLPLFVAALAVLILKERLEMPRLIVFRLNGRGFSAPVSAAAPAPAPAPAPVVPRGSASGENTPLIE